MESHWKPLKLMLETVSQSVETRCLPLDCCRTVKRPRYLNLINFDRVVDESEIAQEPFCYFEKNAILMRKWRPLTNVPAEDDWAVKSWPEEL